jgi:hypothetical protein
VYVQPDDGFMKLKPRQLNNKRIKAKLAVADYLFEEE